MNWVKMGYGCVFKEPLFCAHCFTGRTKPHWKDCTGITIVNFGVYVSLHYRERAKSMFYHAYDSYMNYAYPYDELRPLTCDGHNTWGR